MTRLPILPVALIVAFLMGSASAISVVLTGGGFVWAFVSYSVVGAVTLLVVAGLLAWLTDRHAPRFVVSRAT